MLSPRSLFRRAWRYLNVYAWLIRQHLRFHPVLFVTQQGLAVSARIGTIAGLIACAHFIAHLIVAVERPTTHTLGYGLELANDEFKALMIGVPVGILLAAALFQYLATVLFGRLIGSMTAALATDYTERMAGAKVIIPLTSGGGYSRVLHLLLRIESRFLFLLQNMLILSGVIFGSILVVGPLIALGMIVLLLTFIGVFLLFRQTHAHELHGKLADLDRKRLDILKKVKPGPASTDTSANDAHNRLLDQLARVIHTRFYLNWSFRESSRTAGLLVQAGLVAAILLYVATAQTVDPGQFAKLVSLFVIMRFAFGTVQAINTTALAITPDYPALVRIMESRDCLDVRAPSAGMDNDEDEDRMV